MLPPILLMRHGETLWNRERRMQGALDSPLTLRGIAQASACAELVRARLDGAATTILSSPLGRAWQSAAIAAETIGFPPGQIVLEPNLREISWGEWDGLTASQIEDVDQTRWQRVIDAEFREAPPAGESIQQVRARVSTWFDQMSFDRPTLLVAHGMVGRALRAHYLCLSDNALMQLQDAHESVFELSDGRIIDLAETD